MVDSIHRTPANNTKKLVAALAPLEQYGLDATQRAIVGFGRFPVAGVASWSDDWWFPRFGPVWRLHQGVDIFAPYGTPVRAPVDGTVRVTNSGLGGLAVYVRQPNRTYWYLAHLSGLGPGIAEGVTVKTGQVVGFVGTSGNARGGPSHTHMEVHPDGGPAVPPKPVIDRFVTDALAMVPQLLDAYAKAYANRTPVTVPTPAPAPAIEALSPRTALLWATAANPAGGTLKLVEADALAAADRIDWSAVVAASAERARATEAARSLLLPLVPEPLADAAGWR
jgi:murein DD-endopeptidase MepM/ murein hydrolase activator NlpD